ncbi:RHS repeat-associated core domain-containing protein [Wukongibacter sp. M2B1]|uniref:RHS repeat-associated core domain-containing protein n=1 Tax=Wukongibacter sp. M2B1 TaxID=3088895 RepID=UPI003D7BF4D5
MTQQSKILDGYIINMIEGEEFPQKIKHAEDEYEGILEKIGTPYRVIVEPGEQKDIKNYKVGFGDETPDPFFQYEKGEFKGELELKEVKTEDGHYEEGEPKDFEGVERENIETGYYEADGTHIRSTYTWDNTDDHDTLEIDGYLGELSKVSGEKVEESRADNPDGTYVITRKWKAIYEGTLYKAEWVEGAYNVGIYEGEVMKDPVYGYRQDYRGPGQTIDYKQKNFGDGVNQECVNDPVNIITGNYYCKDTDLKIQDYGPSLEIVRHYNALDQRKGILGKSWRINYDSTLKKRESGDVAIIYENGQTIVFSPVEGTREYKGPEAIHDTVYKNTDGTYDLKKKNEYTYRYSRGGKLIFILDKNNNKIAIDYSSQGKIETVTSASGKTLTFTYEEGKLKKIQEDTSGRELNYSYDENDNLEEATKTSGGKIKYSYNEHGITSIADEKDITYIKNKYDEFGRIKKQRDVNDDLVIYTYSELDMVNSVTDLGAGTTVAYDYNEKLYLTKRNYDDETYEEFTYDQSGNKESIEDRDGNTTSFSYDEKGNILSVTPPEKSGKTTYEYDDQNNLTKIEKPGGRVKTFEYDSEGNLIKITEKIDDSTEATTKYTYNTRGQIETKEDAEGNITTLQYDTEGNLKKIIDPENNETEYSYDSLNRKISEAADTSVIRYQYNDQDKIEKIIDSIGNTTRMKYDTIGNLIKIINPEQYNEAQDDGLGITYEYDGMDRPIKQTNQLSHSAAVTYDQQGNKTKEINPNNYTGNPQNDLGTTYEYDKITNRLIKIRNEEGNKTRIKYDTVGNRTQVINAKYYNEVTDDGESLKYVYDLLNRLIEIKDKGGKTIRKYIYDAAGNIEKEIDAKGKAYHYKYNAIGWLIEKRIPLKEEQGETYYRVEKYSYDKTGRITKEKKSAEYVTLTGEPSQYHTIENTYYKNGKIKTTKDTNGAYIEYYYNGQGKLAKQKTKINETTYQIIGFDYDSLGRIEKKWFEIYQTDLAEDSQGTAKSEITYKYDKNSNITKITSPQGYITRFEYDEADNLVKKQEEVQIDHLDTKRAKVYVNSDTEAVYPDQNYEYPIYIETDQTIKGTTIEIDYDTRVFSLQETQKEDSSTQINDQTTGTIRIDIQNANITGKTKIATLKMKTKDSKEGFGFIEIKPSTNYTNGEGSTENYTEIIGKIVYIKRPDMNADNEVEVRDFTITALQKGTQPSDLVYNPKFDINNNKEVDIPDLDYIKDWIFNNKTDSLQKIEALKYGVKHTNETYTTTSEQGIRETTYKYDKVGNIIEEIDSAGNKIEYTYDKQNRLVKVKDREGGQARYHYDQIGNLIKEIRPENYRSSIDGGIGRTYQYDYLNRLTEIRNEEGNLEQKNTYDVNGNITEKTDPLGQITQYTYDIGNRLRAITTPGSREKAKTTAEYTYDAQNNVTSYTDGEGIKTTYERDLWGNPLKISRGEKVVTTYEYDYAGNLIKTTDGNKKATKYKYNSINKLKQIIDPRHDEITYKYDRQGRIKEKQHRSGKITEYTYNQDDQITKRKIKGTEEEEKYLFNRDGTMLAAINSTQVESYEYNKNYQLIKKYRNGKPQLAYSYNLDGNIKTITTSSPSPEEKIDYTYDPIGRLKTVAYKTDEVAKYSYNPDSTVNAVQYDTGIKINYNYTKDRDIEAITAKNPLDEIITQSSYQYDNNRNLISEAMDGKTTTYQYDELSRLKEVLYPTNITETFTYDGAGNRKTRTYGSETTTYIYDSKNMLKQSSKGNNTTFYYYDPDGNLIDKREDEKTTTYEYDGFGRQIKALLPDGRCQINKYNALDQRTESVENGIAKQYTYNGRNVIIEKDQGEEKTGLYIRGLELISKINKNDQKAYYLHNRHGDITQIVDGQGKTLNKYEYDPFGNLIKSTERINNKHKYAGEQYDEITGQYYLRARYYDPQVGRFTQEDTYRGDGLNLYAYVANNPLKYIDPSGHGKDGIVDNNQVPTVGDPERKLVLKNEYNEMKRISEVNSKVGVSGPNEVIGGGDNHYILPFKELNEVDKKALHYAEKAVEKTMYKTQHGIFGEYSIAEYSYGYLYKQSFDNRTFQSEMWDSGADLLNKGASLYMAGKSTEKTGSLLNDAGTVLSKAAISDQEPDPTSVGNIASFNPYDGDALEKARKKMEVINSSPYKYVIYASGPRKKYIKELDKQIEVINLMDIDNDRYKGTMLNYIENIKNLNINHKQSEKDIKFLIKSIDNMYK